MKKFDEYIKSINYSSMLDMKIDSKSLLQKISNNEDIQIIDVRFKKEFEIWTINFIKNIPLNKIHDWLDEIDKNKLIVTTCPIKDRAIIAMQYLKLKGFENVRYLSDGLTQLIMNLIRSSAKKNYNKINTK